MKTSIRRRVWLLLPIISGLVLILGFLLYRSGKVVDRPNLVLIIVDTLRADHLGCYGYHEARTPRIDALAGSGVRFENAVSHIPFTLPAITSIMSSTLPPTNGVHYNEGFYVDNSVETIAEVLSDNGYASGAVVASIVLRSESGIAQGFGLYNDRCPPEYVGFQEEVKRIESQLGGIQKRAEEVTDTALGLADSLAGESPFFLFVHYYDPHYPKDPPPAFAPPVDRSGSADPQERLVELYDGEIAYTDLHVGRLIDGLDERGLLKNSLVVLTSDHGEGLGEHKEMQHGFFVYDQTIHIPLIFVWPGKLPAGEVRRALARHIDIAPTMLDILGVPWRDRTEFQGTSLLPLDDDDKSPKYSYFEAAMPYLLRGWCGLRGIRNVEWKYISAPREELYHLTTDPGEEKNLIDREPEVTESMRDRLDRMVSELPIYQNGASGQELSLGEKSLIDPFVETGLRALGYLGSAKHYSSTYEEIFNRSLPDPKDKIEDYKRSKSSDLLVTMGMASLERNSPGEAIKELNTVIASNPSNVHAYFYLGLAYRETGGYAKAIEMFEQSLQIDPTYIKANLALSDIHLLQGDSTLARAELEGALSTGIYSRKELLLAISLLERLGARGRAIEVLKGTLEDDPDDVVARIYLGEYSLINKDYGTALSYLEPLDLSRETDHDLLTRAYYARGRCYYQRGEPNRSLEMFQRLISIDPTIAAGHNQLGLIYDDLEEYDNAIRHYREALALDPDMAEVHSNLGVSYYKMGKYREAREEFETYLTCVEDEEEAARLKAYIEQIREME